MKYIKLLKSIPLMCEAFDEEDYYNYDKTFKDGQIFEYYDYKDGSYSIWNDSHQICERLEIADRGILWEFTNDES
jgi:hypothetical protein